MLAYSATRSADVETGFLIVKTFPQLYAEYRDRYDSRRDWYAIPRVDREPGQSPIQYRGLDRDALDDYDKSDLSAEVNLAILELDGRVANGIIFSRQDVQETLALLGPLQPQYEAVWARLAGSSVAPPDGYSSIGFEATYFVGGHFSPSCDCMLFPRWHGTDKEGELFLPHFRQLNPYGLFGAPEVARAFLEYYRSFDWTEVGEYAAPEEAKPGDYVIAEVFIRR